MEEMKNLLNVKLIIGNGFDLYCGLKTSYNHYFDFNQDKYRFLDKSFCEKILFALQWQGSAASVYYSAIECFNASRELVKLNCWDLYFLLAARDSFKGGNWCDVEEKLLESLQDSDDLSNLERLLPHWGNVYQYLTASLSAKKTIRVSTGSKILAFFIEAKRKSLGLKWKSSPLPDLAKGEFYEYILSELKEFELDFATFITKQHVAYKDGHARINTEYIDRSCSFFDSLSRLIRNITSIDCFNYDCPPNRLDKLYFINGNCISPIFGVDSKFKPTDPEYIFTKTNRRVELGMLGRNTRLSVIEGYNVVEDFDNALVFGHSLSKADYNYFFPILDELEICDFASKKKFVVAYSIYDGGNEFDIKKGLRESLYALFTAYAKYKGKGEEEANRLLDTLTIQRRVLTIELPRLKPYESFVFSQRNNDDWGPDALELRQKIQRRWTWYEKVVQKHGTMITDFEVGTDF